MNDRLEKIFAAVAPGESAVLARVVDASSPAEIGKTIVGPEFYRLLLVNEGDLDISSVASYSGGFATEDDDTVLELEKRNEVYGELPRTSALLLQKLDHGMLDFLLWYYLKLTFADDTQLFAKFDIAKAYALREANRRLIPVLKDYAYVFELKPFEPDRPSI